MQSLEAIQRLMKVARDYVDGWIETHLVNSPEAPMDESVADLDVAAKVVEIMLNTALPIARFRLYVELDEVVVPKKQKQLSSNHHHEFTTCSVTIDGIKSSITFLSRESTNCRLILWEQATTVARMVTGFQGDSKSKEFRLWLKSLDLIQTSGNTLQ